MDALKDLFENYIPGEELPAGHEDRFDRLLEEKLHPTKLKYRITLAATAAIILLLILPFAFGHKESENKLILANTDEETIESEYYLQNEIKSRMAVIDTINPIWVRNLSLMRDIKDLDESLNTLKDDLKESPNDQRIINAVINTYRLKIDALDNILTILQKYS